MTADRPGIDSDIESLLRDYGEVLQQWAAEVGGWKNLGREIERLLAAQALDEDTRQTEAELAAILEEFQIPCDVFGATEIWVALTSHGREAAREEAARWRQAWLDYKAAKRADWIPT